MSEQRREVSEDEIAKFFHKHLVPLYFVFSDGTNSHSTIVTAFALSVRDHWFLITAGHSIGEVETLRSEYGYSIERCLLIDSLGTNARDFEPVPFDYVGSNPMQLSDDLDFDYGVIYLRPYYCHLLKANGVVPFDESVWKLQPEEAHFYVLVGVPAELTVFSPKTVEVTATLHPIERIDAPSEAAQKDVPLFYGKVELGDISDIGGTSGGPILGFSQLDSGELRYWLVALQSRWLKSSRRITACPTKTLGALLEEILAEI